MEEAELLLRPLAPAPWGTYCLPALLQYQSLDSPWRVLPVSRGCHREDWREEE